MTTTPRPTPFIAGRSKRWTVPRTALRLLAAAALAVAAYVHLHLAATYDFGPAITLGQLFIAQAVLVSAIGVWLVVSDSRPAWLAATGVMAASCSAVVISTYHQIPAIGPFPSLYEPVWFTEKAVSAIVEGGFVLLALGRLALRRR